MAKVKNVSVNIQIGKREYCFKNLILNTLLNNFANSLIDNYNGTGKILSHCLLKFENFENITENTTLINDDFDICILNTSSETISSSNKITNRYVCYTEDNYIYDYERHTAINVKLSDYNNRKIHWIGFSNTFAYRSKVLAMLDVSNYDLYIEEGEEIRVTRIDEISTDAIFTSLSESINAPIHLYPNGIQGILPKQEIWDSSHQYGTTVDNRAYAKLTNFGFGNNTSELDVEYDMDNNYEVNDNIFTIKNIWSPIGLYPSDNLYPSNNLYPDDPPFNYLILRFKLFQKVAEDDATYEDVINGRKLIEKYTGAEYLQAIPLNIRGFVDLNIKYERG